MGWQHNTQLGGNKYMSVAKSILWSPSEYAESAVIAREAGEEMLSRLDWMTFKPRLILDIGAGTGEMSMRLQARYPEASVVAMDLVPAMLEYAQQHTPGIHYVCADTCQLPLPDHSVDFIFANLLLPWCPGVTSVLSEWRRVLRPDGLLMFSALGPDTLRAWPSLLFPTLADMHDLGDLLLKTGLADPVLDVCHYTIAYKEQARFIRELQSSGMSLAPEGLLAPSASGTWDACFEVVYAHAFAPSPSEETAAATDGVTYIPLAHLRKQLRG
jgi:malonyl-CoA O-methyltransferase